MTVKTTIRFTDRHPRFLTDQVGHGVFASRSAAVAAALEQMMRDEEKRELALGAMAEEIRARLDMPQTDYVSAEKAFADDRARLQTAREA